MARRIVLVAVALVTAACGQGGGPRAARSGITGRVIAFPTCPVFIETSPCPKRAVQTTVSIEAVDGGHFERVRTASDGTFRVAVQPGDYVLMAMPPPSDPTLVPKPASASVEPRTFVRVTVVLDTRLREPVGGS